MAKTPKLEREMDEIEEKGPGFFKKFFLFVIIPVLFTIAIFLIVATFTNTNVFQMAQKLSSNIPFVASKEEKETEIPAIDEGRVVELQAEIQERNAEIEQLNTKIEQAALENQELIAEQERLLFEIEKLKRGQEDTKREFNELLSTYEKMSAKKAALIIVEMSETEALRILASMKPDKLAEVLSKMTPVNAAKYTELLAKQ